MKNILLIAAFIVALFGCSKSSEEVTPTQKEWFRRVASGNAQGVITPMPPSPEHARIIGDSVFLVNHKHKTLEESFLKAIDYRAKLNQNLALYNGVRRLQEYHIYLQNDTLVVSGYTEGRFGILELAYYYYTPIKTE